MSTGPGGTARPRLGLGAGGTTGEAFHRGVLRAMQEVGLDPRSADVVVGTSAGSIVAASVRRRGPAGEAPPLHRLPPGRPGNRAAALELFAEEMWALRDRGDRVVTVEPDAAVLGALRLNTMDGRRVDQVERRAYELACRRLAAGRNPVAPPG